MIRRKKRMSPVVPTSSMGDIAFLLIIFFMLASTFMKSANVTVETPLSDDIDIQDPPMVEVVIDVDGNVWMQGAKVGISELTANLKAQAEELRDDPVHLRVSKGLLRKSYMPVIEAISEAGVKMVLTGEPENKKK